MRDLHAGVVADPQAGVDRGGSGAPVLVQLESRRAGRAAAPTAPPRETVLPLPSNSDIDRPVVGGLEHPREVPRARRDGRRLRALGRAGAAADDRGDARAERLVRASCGQMKCTWQSTAPAVRILPLPGEDLGRRADHQIGVDAVHRVGVAGLADADDAPVADADVGLDDAPVVEDDRAGDDEVGRALGPGRAGLAHRLADDLAAAEHDLVAGRAQRDRPLDLDEQVGVGQADAIADGGSVQLGVAPARLSSTGIERPPRPAAARPGTMRAPASGHQRDLAGDAGLEAHGRARRRCPVGAPRARRGRSAARDWRRRSGSASRPARAGRRCSRPAAVRGCPAVVDR